MRVLLDANVLISALLSKAGTPARLLRVCAEGQLDLIVCPALLEELENTLARPKFRARLDPSDVERFLRELSETAELLPDPETPVALRSVDPSDDYLIALAARENIPLVSGDAHLLALGERAPVFSPRDFLEQLELEADV